MNVQKLYYDTDLEWHTDLADCAIEQDNLEALKFIVEKMGRVKISIKEANENCKAYLSYLLSNPNNTFDKDNNLVIKEKIKSKDK